MKTKVFKKFGGLSPRYRIVFLMGVLVVTICGAVFAIERENKIVVESASPHLVRAFTVIPAQSDAAEYTGVIHARTESDLGFRVSGKILEKLVKAGDHVQRGEALMRLDSTDLKLAVNAAQAAVEAARALNKRALADDRRQRELVAIKAVSVQEYEQAKSAAEATTAQLNSALAYAAQLENQVGYAILRAEANGVVMDVPADVGQVVAAGAVVVHLAHDGAREAVIDLPEGKVELAKSKAVARLYADPGQTFPAKLRELSAMADPLTRTYQARYRLGGVGENAPLGATVTVDLDGDNANEAVQEFEIPIGALYDAGTGTSVWVINPDTSSLSRRQIEVAKLGSETALVSKGLKSGRIDCRVGSSPRHGRGTNQDPPRSGEGAKIMSRFNLSAFAVRERAITLFMIIAIMVAGGYAFLHLGRAEDPQFTVKVLTVSAVWPGATAKEMQEQVGDRLEKRLQELEFYDRVQTAAYPGMLLMKLYLKDSTPPKDVPDEFYQARKKLGDEKIHLPRGVIGPIVNDEYSDVYFAMYSLEAKGLPQRQLVLEAEALRQRFSRISRRRESHHSRGAGPQDLCRDFLQTPGNSWRKSD